MAKLNTYTLPELNLRPPMPVDLGWYGDIRFDASDLRPDYIGCNILRGADAGATDWKVYKFTYDGTTSDITRIELAYGSWTGRAALFP